MGPFMPSVHLAGSRYARRRTQPLTPMPLGGHVMFTCGRSVTDCATGSATPDLRKMLPPARRCPRRVRELPGAEDLRHFCRPRNKVTICHVTVRAPCSSRCAHELGGSMTANDMEPGHGAPHSAFDVLDRIREVIALVIHPRAGWSLMGRPGRLGQRSHAVKVAPRSSPGDEAVRSPPWPAPGPADGQPDARPGGRRGPAGDPVDRSKTRSNASEGRPTPVSATVTRARSRSRETPTVTVPPVGVAASAFPTRFVTTWPIRSGSTSQGTAGPLGRPPASALRPRPAAQPLGRGRDHLAQLDDLPA